MALVSADRLSPASDGPGDKPRFTVVVPAYNEEEFLGDCLDSLMKQDFDGDYEVIVVDNNSTDRTAEIAASRGVTVVREENPGVCWARQCGTAQASGEIVISTDADTIFDQAWLSRIDSNFRRDPSLVAVAGPCRFVDAPWWGSFYTWALFGMVRLMKILTGKVLYITATNIAFRKCEWSGYDTSARQGGDELALLRQLRSRGEILFDAGNPSFTSSRRLYHGLVYNVFATFLFYYVLGYWLHRMLGRSVVGSYPAFRSEARSSGARTRVARWRVERLVIAAVCLGLCVLIGGLAHHFVDHA